MGGVGGERGDKRIRKMAVYAHRSELINIQLIDITRCGKIRYLITRLLRLFNLFIYV